MKKRFLSIVVLALAAMICCTGCKKKEDSLTKEDAVKYLTGAKHGWIATAATCPAGYTMNDGTVITDLLNDGYFQQYEADNIMLFKSDNIVWLRPGKDKYVDEYSDEGEAYEMGNWSVSDDAKTLHFYFPTGYDPAFPEDSKTDASIVELTENSLKVRFAFTISELDVKAAGTYTFVVTYRPAKASEDK